MGAGLGVATGEGLGVAGGAVGVGLGVCDASTALISAESGPMSDVTFLMSAPGSAADTPARPGSRSGRPLDVMMATMSAIISMAAMPVIAAIVLRMIPPCLLPPTRPETRFR